jgi:serine/threonine protein phosphatase 1
LKTCVIGDIHGCHTSLLALLDKVKDLADTLVFIGDYVDRGPASKQVLETLIQLRGMHPHVIFLKGNHELMFLGYLKGTESSTFLSVGGQETMDSYNLNQDSADTTMLEQLPPPHLAFLENLPLYYEDRHGIYVHAGLQPGRHLTTQTADWCLWVRDRFIRSTVDFNKPVIFGHTVFREPLIEANKIGIDTGAVYGGKLTALLLPDMEFIQVDGELEHPFPGHL